MTGPILNGFLSPASIAVIGASNDLEKPGGKILACIAIPARFVAGAFEELVQLGVTRIIPD